MDTPAPVDVDTRARWTGRAMIAYGILAGLTAVAYLTLSLAGTLLLSLIGASDWITGSPDNRLMWTLVVGDHLVGRLLAVVWAAGQSAVALAIVAGGVMLTRLDNRPFAVLGAVLCVLPGATACCIGPVGLVVGVAALVVLFQAPVVDAFEARKADA